MELWKKLAFILGIFLWVGALSPEIFVKSGIGCIYDNNGNELDKDKAYEFMEAFFVENAQIDIDYKFLLIDIFGGNGKK